MSEFVSDEFERFLELQFESDISETIENEKKLQKDQESLEFILELLTKTGLAVPEEILFSNPNIQMILDTRDSDEEGDYSTDFLKSIDYTIQAIDGLRDGTSAFVSIAAVEISCLSTFSNTDIKMWFKCLENLSGLAILSGIEKIDELTINKFQKIGNNERYNRDLREVVVEDSTFNFEERGIYHDNLEQLIRLVVSLVESNMIDEMKDYPDGNEFIFQSDRISLKEEINRLSLGCIDMSELDELYNRIEDSYIHSEYEVIAYPIFPDKIWSSSKWN